MAGGQLLVNRPGSLFSFSVEGRVGRRCAAVVSAAALVCVQGLRCSGARGDGREAQEVAPRHLGGAWANAGRADGRGVVVVVVVVEGSCSHARAHQKCRNGSEVKAMW